MPGGVLRSDLLDTLFWLAAVPAVLATMLSIKRGRRFLDYAEERVLHPVEDPPTAWRSVALIVPVKGDEPGLGENLLSLTSQDYPSFELIVVCASRSDPAIGIAQGALGSRCRVIIAGDPPPDTGEKVHNLSAAARAVGESAEILAFADSDGVVQPGWLRKLVAPLGDPDLGAVTAFRWHFPDEGGFWPLMRSVWDSSIASIMSIEDKSFAWGGGMALKREAFESAKVLQFWKGAVSDDYRLTHAMRAAGLGIRFVPEAMVETPGQCTGPEFLAWTVRQLTITRVYDFRMWLGGCVSHIFYCVAQVLCLLQVAQGRPLLGLGALLLILLPGMAQGGMRGYVGSLVFPHREPWMNRHGWAYFWMTPIATWVWLYAFLRSGTTRRIQWRGRTYELLGESRTREVGRS